MKRTDHLLKDWQQKVGLISQNLLELHDLDIYHRLLQQRGQLDPTESIAIATHHIPLHQRQIAGSQIHNQLWSLDQLLDNMTGLFQAIADRAHTLLYQRPTPLDQAADLVTQYEQCLKNPCNHA